MTQPVAIGDDGRNPYQDPDDGPLLAALREFFNGWLGSWAKAMEQQRTELLQALLLREPAYAPVKQSGTIDANGNLVLDVGGPELGRRWTVRMIVFSDAGSFWNTMGNAQVTVGTGIKTGATVTPDSVRWPFSVAPNAATFGADEFTITARDRLLLAVTGGTSAQAVQCTAWIQDFDATTVRFRGTV
jgi:hypothetical protein